MTTQIISLEALQKVRQHIKTMLTLPESENCPRLSGLDDRDQTTVPNSLADLGDLFRVGACLEDGVPMPNDQGMWFLSVMEPSMAIAKLPHINLKPGYRLITYLYRVRESGCGSTWALPAALATTAHLELALDRASQEMDPPCPTGALPDFMAAIEGNNQPVSFVIASILRRELQEFGRLGTQQEWRQHRLIASAPTQARWQWRTDTAPDLNPKIRLRPDGQIIVEFFSCRVHPSVAIFQHLDQYEPGEYVAQSIDRPIAFAEHKTH
jgi:hypothetical protein